MNIRREKEIKPLWSKNFVMLLIVNLLLCVGFQMLLPILPIYVKSMGASDSVVGLIASAFVVSAFLIRPVSGYMLDRTGRLRILIAGAGVAMISIFAYGCISAIFLIFIFRFVHGIGWGAFTTATSTIATDSIPKERVGEGIGYYGLTSSLAMAVGPIIALYILDMLDINRVFMISAAFTALSLILAFTIKCKKADKAELPHAKIVMMEKTAIRPSSVMFFISVTFGVVQTFLPLYAASDLGYTNVGVFFAVYAVALIVSRPLFGVIVDRLGADFAVIPGMILVALSMILLSTVSSPEMFIAIALIDGVGYGACQSSLHAMSVMKTPTVRAGAANATFFSMFDSGMALGAIVAGVLATAYGYGVMFLMTAGTVFVAAALYFTVVRKTLPHKEKSPEG